MLAGRGMQAQRLEYMDWPFLPAALPIIMCSLAYHCMIPATCRSLGGRPRLVWKALFWGVTITTAFNLLWIAVVSGALPLAGPTGLAEALRLNQPATVPLAAALHSPAVTLAGLFFSICAILTSYLGVGVALTGFMKDLVGPLLPRKDRLPLALIVYGPPLAVVYIYPDLFLKVLDIIGGLGLGLVFGVCPALMLLKNGVGFGSRRRLWGLLLLGFFAALMALEAAQELGWLHIAPGVEYWKLGGRAG
jgi:tyrosine-specific transport protein